MMYKDFEKRYENESVMVMSSFTNLMMGEVINY